MSFKTSDNEYKVVLKCENKYGGDLKAINTEFIINKADDKGYKDGFDLAQLNVKDRSGRIVEFGYQ